MEFKINIGRFIYTQDEKGDWIYKADDSVALKKNGILKSYYKDFPRYKAIVQFEDVVKKDYEQTLKNMNNEIFNFLKDTL